MKKILKVITRLEITKAYDEGKRGYYDGKRRGYNPYIGQSVELTDAWWEGWDRAKEASDKRAIRRVLYIPVSFIYHIYGIAADAIERYKRRNGPPLPPVPCQICGRLGHKAKYCPNVKQLGY